MNRPDFDRNVQSHQLALGNEPDCDAQYQRPLNKEDKRDRLILLITYWVLLMMVGGSLLFFVALFIWMWVTGEVAPI